MAKKFILNRLKEKFGGGKEDDSDDGFPDMNYLIGNSSAMDIGEVPTPMDERIGYASQIGGQVMELQITTPSTFTLERDAMISTIDQLGLDITLHSDMNAGYASAQKSGQGEQYGYDTVEKYFTSYLQELAQFKHHVKEKTNAEFNIGRINPHISTTPMPPLQERMETDVAVDPFGFITNTYDEENRKRRNHHKQNIYKNPKFLRKLYHTLFLELSNYPFQQYQTFSAYSTRFDEEWIKARNIAAWEIFEQEADTASEKLGAILTARQQDQGVGSEWRKILDNWSMEKKFPQFKVRTQEEDDEQGNTLLMFDGFERKGSVSLKQILRAYGRQDPSQLRALEGIIYALNNSEFEFPSLQQGQEALAQIRPFITNVEDLISFSARGINTEPALNTALPKIAAKISEKADLWEKEIKRALDQLWYPDSFEKEDQNISQEAKWTGLQRNLEVEQIRLFEMSYQLGQTRLDEMDMDIKKMAEDVFSGKNPEKYFDPDDREDKLSSPDEMHEDMLERILSGQQFQREMWKESVIFYMIMPAWMSCSNESNEDHSGWSAPKFIWETIVVDKWGDRDDVNLDLEDPRNGVYDENGSGVYHYLDLLEKSDEFQRDVCAAVGACYTWAHFTQRKVQFDLKGRDFGLSSGAEDQVENDGWTWIKWMNKFGIGVNLETMAGSPQTRFKVWRPKDIAVAAHAINMTTREQLDDLNDEIDGCPAKFTIDMEHVASLGAPPLDEMERFWRQEEKLAKNHPELGLDPDKPIARILRQMHLMDPGVEGQRGTHHGAFERGNKLLYNWLYKFVKHGFTRNENEPATILFELAEHKAESSYMMKITMNLIELGVTPDEVDPSNVSPGEEPEDEKEALIARFFGMEQVNYNREWAKIEQHAFDPLKGLLEAEEFDFTYSSRAAVENDNRPAEFGGEEYR